MCKVEIFLASLAFFNQGFMSALRPLEASICIWYTNFSPKPYARCMTSLEE